jgi:hypothetical protein
MTATDTSKLLELRSKTDRQLLVLISHRLEAGSSAARLPGERNHAEAERAYADANSLLRFVRLDDSERSRLEVRLKQLGRALRLPIACAACF